MSTFDFPRGAYSTARISINFVIHPISLGLAMDQNRFQTVVDQGDCRPGWQVKFSSGQSRHPQSTVSNSDLPRHLPTGKPSTALEADAEGIVGGRGCWQFFSSWELRATYSEGHLDQEEQLAYRLTGPYGSAMGSWAEYQALIAEMEETAGYSKTIQIKFKAILQVQ
ncbi:hypothetical protein AVEN_14757-1 [Araneus ventricosus]|uniref:Uncharacterized protein n=1 Tax=Araneus ventricosus TaxID=182803 RepID=A0A4Y2DHH6_ARAVE|nr:hypothetical protein AVEN_14757-1 [Araneus ventricosus]